MLVAYNSDVPLTVSVGIFSVILWVKFFSWHFVFLLPPLENNLRDMETVVWIILQFHTTELNNFYYGFGLCSAFFSIKTMLNSCLTCMSGASTLRQDT